MNRRHFLKNSAVAASALSAVGIPTIVPATVFGKNAPSNRISVGLIGTGRQQSPTSKPSIKYTGSDGWILVDNYPGIISSSKPALLTSKPGGSDLDLSKTRWDKVDFVDAIKTGRKTLEPIEVGHRTISISQIGLIACQIGGKLNWNPEKERFVGNNAANALLVTPLARKEWAM